MNIGSGVEAVSDSKNKKERVGKGRKGKERKGKDTVNTHKSFSFHTRIAKIRMMLSLPNLAQLLI